ncbi:MAG TPA: hypothetical protein PK402_14660 [Tepidisphaeraceae bacterium]|nr:hypothetical protein [Tepidisphaeraceae bacterium]
MAEPSHSYYDWQMSTLLLAYDAVEPLKRDDHQAQMDRESKVDRELYELVHATLPQSYRDNPSAEFPPEVVVLLTRALLDRAHAIIHGK